MDVLTGAAAIDVEILGFQARVDGPEAILSALQKVLPIAPARASPVDARAPTRFTVTVGGT